MALPSIQVVKQLREMDFPPSACQKFASKSAPNRAALRYFEEFEGVGCKHVSSVAQKARGVSGYHALNLIS